MNTKEQYKIDTKEFVHAIKNNDKSKAWSSVNKIIEAKISDQLEQKIENIKKLKKF